MLIYQIAIKYLCSYWHCCWICCIFNYNNSSIFWIGIHIMSTAAAFQIATFSYKFFDKLVSFQICKETSFSFISTEGIYSSFSASTIL